MEDTLRDLEYTLAFHGAPALAGIKPADLVAWGSPQVCMGTLLEDYRRQLSRCGIQLRLLCSCRPRCLILVYRPERLAAQLARPQVRALLAREGYPVDRGLEEMLDALQLRLTCGAFPTRSVCFWAIPGGCGGLSLHRGRDYKLCGCWKVVLRRGGGEAVLPPVRPVPRGPVPAGAGGRVPAADVSSRLTGPLDGVRRRNDVCDRPLGVCRWVSSRGSTFMIYIFTF